MNPIYANIKEINIEKIKKIKMIQKGSFGVVYEAEDKETGKLYAAKVICSNDDEIESKQMIEREVQIMACVQHPTIVKLIGYSKVDFHNEPNLTIIMELAENGSLSDVIKSILNYNGPSDYTNTKRQIILLGISVGLKCLHEHKIIHRDIKAANILLDSDFHPHITDFGLSKFLDIENSYEQSKLCGTIAYSAPEILQNKKYNRKADVYSFGILMYEIITDSFAYPEVINGKMTIFDLQNKVVNEHYRPKLDETIKEGLRQLVE